MKQLLSYLLLLLGSTFVYAQITTTTHIDGLRSSKNSLLALTNATIVVSPKQILENASILILNESIVAVGKNIDIPKSATIRDMRGMWIYPAFVESYSNVAIGPAKKTEAPIGFDEDSESPTSPTVQSAKHWNMAVKPEQRAIENLQVEDKAVDEFRKIGFATINTNSMDGIFRGSNAVILAKQGTASQITLSSDTQQWISFRKGTSKTAYPSALMGSIALIRQTLLDAQWYAANKPTAQSARIEFNSSYDALSASLAKKNLFVFENENEHSILRSSRLAKEFNLNILYEGSGYEYRRLSSLVPLSPTIIIPLNFPSVPDVSQQERRLDVSLADLKHWDSAPENPYLCDSAGINIVLTSHGLRSKDDFWKNLRKAIKRGLSKDKALAALTTKPADILGLSATVGSLVPKSLANLLIASGDVFEDSTEIYSTFVAGDEFVYKTSFPFDIRGTWEIESGMLQSTTLTLTGDRNQPTCSVKKGSTPLQSKMNVTATRIELSINADTTVSSQSYRINARIDSTILKGTLLRTDGTEELWTARKIALNEYKKVSTKTNETPIPQRALQTLRPHTAFGYQTIPKVQTTLIKNATLWTSNPAADVLENTDILLRNGKIISIGKNLTGADIVIDGTGKHVTPGIIDEHSHIAIEQGVNEGTHAITAEVRIGDVLYPDDINIYRQLSGGVTSSHLLHGSANPIGGQLQLIKLRWGSDAEGLKFTEAPGTIKFALGENVKQANWGDKFTIRYPQTRMGVEEIMRDAFQNALNYESSLKSIPTTRRDIQAETILEIIRGKRFIHCHSYVQSEILSLMRVCEEFNFKVKNFTHILEGYKVAKEMKEHGTTASSFADWWAYKMEVQDAIPQNPAILHEQGVVTSINSDDAEMARRLNQEAAKSVKYGGVSEKEALKMITINPAIQLNVSEFVGSLEVGKHADVVLWSGHPLSNLSRVLQTYVDGIKYFDIEADVELRQRDRLLRAELEQRALRAIQTGEHKSPIPSSKRREYDCEDVENCVDGNELQR